MTSTHALPAPPPRRDRTLLVATSFTSVGVVMLFAALFGIYITERTSALALDNEWFPSGSISLVPGGMMMVTLLMSAITMQWAVHAIARRDRTHTYIALALTLVFAVAVVNQMVFVWTSFAEPVDASVAALLFYVITGAFVALLVGATVYVALMAIRALAGQYGGRHSDGIVAAALFWYVMIAVYAAVWYTIFVMK